MLLAQFAWGQSEKKLTEKISTLMEMDLKKAMAMATAADQAAAPGHPPKHQAASQTAAVHQQQRKDSADSDEDSIHWMQRTGHDPPGEGPPRTSEHPCLHSD